jgi:hypothetical protein
MGGINAAGEKIQNMIGNIRTICQIKDELGKIKP